jgi:hypothetical protein
MTDTIDKRHCDEHSRRLGEADDCTVYACAVAAQIDYPAMHEYLAELGRKPRSGFSAMKYREALRGLGFSLGLLGGPAYNWVDTYVEGGWVWNHRHGDYVWRDGHYRRTRKKIAPGIDYDSTTVKSLAKELTTGTYLVGTSGHVLCLRDGVVHDWTDGRCHRIRDVWEVTEYTYNRNTGGQS